MGALRRVIEKTKYLIPDSLTHNAGSITATFGSSVYSVALSGLAANTRYQLYIVPGGTLVYSTRENSVGPIGYTSWILVGSFYSNGLGSVAFGSFVNIEGKPVTDNPVQYTPVTQGFGTISTDVCFWLRHGKLLDVEGRFQIGTVQGAQARIGLAGFATDPNYFLFSTPRSQGFGFINRSAANEVKHHCYTIDPTMSVTYLTGARERVDFAISPFSQEDGNQGWFSNTIMSYNAYNIPILAWSATPIKDL